MQTTTLARPVSTSGTGGVIQGTIKAGAKAFSVLVDNIYADKPRSIVREILSNAWDAHQMAGKADKPFSVVFPSLFNPMFTCRDYGEGLSHEFMTTRYTVAFDSTKGDSNEVVGTWGIGRLSPLSYTDTYTATSYQNHVARHYSIVRNDGGVGFVYLGESKTDEPDGFQVSFPIQRNDIDAFRKAFKVVVLGFDVKPTILNPRTDDYWPDLPIAASGSCWSLLDTSKIDYYHPMRGKSFVRMGCVVYPLSDLPELDYTRKRLLQSPILFDAPIGSLAVTASREQLSFGRNEPTLATIESLIDTMAAESAVTTIKAIADAKSYWAASAILRSVRHWSDHIFNKIKTGAEWQSNPVNGYVTIGAGSTYTTPFSVRAAAISGSARSWGSTTNLSYQTTLDPADATFVCVVNVTPKKEDKRADRRIKEYWTDRAYRQIILISFDEEKGTETDLKNLLDYFDGVDVVYVKDITDPGAIKRNSKPVSVKYFNGRYYEDTQITAQELAAGGWYVALNNNVPEHKGRKLRIESLLGILNDNPQIGIASGHPRVWAVPKTHWKKFGGPQWKEIYLSLEEWIATNEATIEQVVTKHVTAQHHPIFKDLVGKTNSPTVVAYNDLFVHDVHPTLKLNRGVLVNLSQHKPFISVNNNALAEANLKTLWGRYPLLQSVNAYNFNSQHVLTYINLIDKANP